MNYRTIVEVGRRRVETLVGRMSASGAVKMLIIAKTPAPVSVEAGHYFQGRQGKMFWGKLREYRLLTVPHGR